MHNRQPVLSENIAALWSDFLRYRETGATLSPDDVRALLETLGFLERHAFDMEQQASGANNISKLISAIECETSALDATAERIAKARAVLEGVDSGKVVMLRMPNGRCPAEVELDHALGFLAVSHGDGDGLDAGGAA